MAVSVPSGGFDVRLVAKAGGQLGGSVGTAGGGGDSARHAGIAGDVVAGVALGGGGVRRSIVAGRTGGAGLGVCFARDALPGACVVQDVADNRSDFVRRVSCAHRVNARDASKVDRRRGAGQGKDVATSGVARSARTAVNEVT